MAEIVNLRAKRKAAARQAARKQADENAAKHGLTKAEKTLQKARAEQARDTLDAHRRDVTPTQAAPRDKTDPKGK